MSAAILRRLVRARRGAVALEFAAVALPFLTLLMFICELGFNFYAQEVMDFGLMTATRQIQIGNAQAVPTAAAFQTQYLCPAITGLLDCGSISINVQPIASDYYTAVSSSLPVGSNGALSTAAYTYCPGRPNQLMLVQAIYTSISVLGRLVPTMTIVSQGRYVHATLSSTAFINENFPVTAAAPAGC